MCCVKHLPDWLNALIYFFFMTAILLNGIWSCRCRVESMIFFCLFAVGNCKLFLACYYGECDQDISFYWLYAKKRNDKLFFLLRVLHLFNLQTVFWLSLHLMHTPRETVRWTGCYAAPLTRIYVRVRFAICWPFPINFSIALRSDVNNSFIRVARVDFNDCITSYSATLSWLSLSDNASWHNTHTGTLLEWSSHSCAAARSKTAWRRVSDCWWVAIKWDKVKVLLALTG